MVLNWLMDGHKATRKPVVQLISTWFNAIVGGNVPALQQVRF
jgi:hypothetical protein